jgi:exosortase/archaeosortase family protein
LVLNERTRLAVVEACSGLRMLTAFIVVAATLAYVVKRPRWQKAIVLLSSIPVAIACNAARLIVTAWLFLWASSETAERFFHDFAGLTMMPLAVLLLVAELWLMNKIVSGKHRAADGFETVASARIRSASEGDHGPLVPDPLGWR